MIPLIVALIVAAVGWWSQVTLEGTMKGRLSDELRTILNADVAALQLWLDTQESVVEAAATAPPIPSLVAQINASADNPSITPYALRQIPAQKELLAALVPVMASQGYEGFAVINESGLLIASGSGETVGRRTVVTQDEAMGNRTRAVSSDLWARLRNGETIIVPPVAFQSPADKGQTVARPAMFVATPVQNERGEFIAALAFRLKPQDTFTHILNVARFGDSGETYAFDASGLMISESRFTDQLREIGLLPDEPDARSTLNMSIRNPGGNMLEGFRPTDPVQALPLTRMAAEAIAGNAGTDVEGYRDYRGVFVVGTWTWLPKYGFGVATEVNMAEAFHARTVVRRAFWTVLALLMLSAAGMFVYSQMVHRLQHKVKKAQKLGQYTLEKKIGEGGMGTVYKARHAILRRPTAIKLIRSKNADEEMVLRFEQEVQLTSQLTHPNTIAIYDYGRTPEGVFYYAMEYIPGITLDSLVKHDGPQPHRRVVHILRQVCASLAEAHALGLIHRDIKPANIMLCERGGIYDVVKVVDFGLVKRVQGAHDPGITAVNEVRGTPLYMAPEMIQSPDAVDARSDLYAVGAVTYYLITGQPVFDSRSTIEILGHHLHKKPVPPSERIGKPVDSYLEELILRCLAKDKRERPANARELLNALNNGKSAPDDAWNEAEARAWWESRADACRTEHSASRRSDIGSVEPTLEINLSDRVSSGSR